MQYATKARWKTKLLVCHTADPFFSSFWPSHQQAILRASTWNCSAVLTKWGTDLIYYPSWAKITVNTGDGYMCSLYKHCLWKLEWNIFDVFFITCWGLSTIAFTPHIVMVPHTNVEAILKSGPPLHTTKGKRGSSNLSLLLSVRLGTLMMGF